MDDKLYQKDGKDVSGLKSIDDKLYRKVENTVHTICTAFYGVVVGILISIIMFLMNLK
jgi:hypothetical protein